MMDHFRGKCGLVKQKYLEAINQLQACKSLQNRGFDPNDPFPVCFPVSRFG